MKTLTFKTYACLAASCLLAIAGFHVSATTTLTVGDGPTDIEINPNQPGQTINLFLSSDSGQVVGGGNLSVIVGAGGPSVGYNGVTGTIFDGGVAIPDANASPLVLDVGLLGPIPSPVLDSTGTQLLGTLTIDTTGLSSGSYSLDLSATLLNDDGAQPITFDLDGATTVTIVPEPTSIALFGLGGLVIGMRRRRREYRGQ